MLKLAALFAVTFSLLGCQNSTDAPPQGGAERTVSTLEELGRQFVTAAAAGDSEKILEMFITRDEFGSTFRGSDLDAPYESLHQQFQNSLGNVLPELTGAQFVKMNLQFCPEPISVEPGTNFGLAKFAVATLSTDNIRVIADVNGEEREVKLDALVKIGEAWCLLSPVSLVSKR